MQIFISMPRRRSVFAIVCIWIIHGCYCCIELTVSSGYIYRCFRFVLPLPDRNRRVPVRNIPFPISRNTGFVFPSGLPVPVPVPDQKIREREWLRHFPDRSRPFSTLSIYELDCSIHFNCNSLYTADYLRGYDPVSIR